jgi:cytochrome P450 family 110
MTFPDGPKISPTLQILQTVVKPLETLEHNFQTYGDWYTARFGNLGEFVVLSHPEAIEAVMTAPVDLFNSGSTNLFLEAFLGSNSLLMLDGRAHQRQRKLLTPPFHGERLKTYAQDICDITNQVTDRWQPGQTFSMRTAVQEISLRVIMRTVFGVYEGERAVQLKQHLDDMLRFFDHTLNAAFVFMPALQKNWGTWSPWSRMLRQIQDINELLFAEIRERRTNPDRLGDDVLSLMMTARDEEGQSMTDQELRDETMTLLFAGHETTATAIAWAMYWIHYLPEVGAKLQKELAELDENCDPVTVTRLPYLSAVCDETLRIYPVGLFTFLRVLNRPWNLMGQEFKPDTIFGPCIYLLHHRSELYPDPHQFRPERFLERKFPPYEYMPFGGSNRRCIGMAFAQFEMKLVVVNILAKWHLKLQHHRPIKPVRRGITIAPAKGVPMQAVKQR